MQTEQILFPEMLKDLLGVRQKLNPQYSLRALARDLHLDQSNLSKMINGKRYPTTLQILKIAKELNLSSDLTVSLITTSVRVKKN